MVTYILLLFTKLRSCRPRVRRPPGNSRKTLNGQQIKVTDRNVPVGPLGRKRDTCTRSTQEPTHEDGPCLLPVRPITLRQRALVTVDFRGIVVAK